MRLKIHKRNVLAFLFATLIALFLLFSIRRNGQSGVDSSRADVHSKELGADDHDVQHAGYTHKFYYDTIFNMKKSVYEGNYRQLVQNADKFPGDPQLVVVVQVHNRPAYLKMLVDSFQKASDIQNVLLIFSQDYFSEEISNIIQGITFCRVLQIYFPYSTQLYPFEFPGQDPKDCPRDVSKDTAVRMKCNNAEYPDSYGHYREASFTQTKHHWWWKLHFVWERVRTLQGYSGYVLFLEEDNYLLPDFVHFFKGMTELKKRECPDCDLLALGNHESSVQFEEMTNKLETSGWLSTKHNIGIGMSKDLYYKLMGCNAEFCTYDDYNWDWTLQNLSGMCLSKTLKVLAAKATRVLHTGDCGLHQKDSCRSELALQKVQEVQELAKKSLFPTSLVISNQESVENKAHVKNGGWGDIRDHSLCKNYAKVL
ncbi:alpha-1,6-mannosyl-glycoprotein 2-beta-N-acetylglucosaminyltransferase [Scleropages formosus]|uniref:Si:ch73-91k6.2 n=1 Tax=Scleropages formosus TaxID=113540 RepID=A0A8C9RX53_SCLFO|nr:alpha-1,6-mannosyl-glycoprotein 2-beta-N-acetylglucosaminyltransferase-like [Scleropages formosus]